MAQNQRTAEPMEHEMTEETPQCQALTSNQVNSVWQVDDMMRLRRFLVLGSELATYNCNNDENQLGIENAHAILRLFKAKQGVEVVNEIVKFSLEGRTVKQNPILLALAMCCRLGDLATQKRAYEVVSQICHIPTHLFMFIAYSKTLSGSGGGTGWGRALRKAIQKWYTEKSPMKLAMDVTKYQKREGWSHADVARCSHLKSEDPAIQCILKYMVRGFDEMVLAFPESDQNSEELNSVLKFLYAVEEMKKLNMDMEYRVVELIEQAQLVREHIPTICLCSKKVWDALLRKMPMTAIIRNLNKMTAVELLVERSSQARSVCDKLVNEELLRKAHIHPFNVLLAMKQYQSGRGDKGSLTWTPNKQITAALEKAFYLSFKNVESTGKSYLLAMDVSGSLQSGGCVGSPSIQPQVASAAMAMVTARTEQNHKFVAFSNTIVPMNINSNMTLEQVLEEVTKIPIGPTDCAQPMLYAKKNNLKIDVFVVYTDCETWFGNVQPSHALKQYREHSGIRDAKLIVVGMTSNGFTIADPEDPGMFDMAGFDSAAPQVMREFILGNI